MSSRGRKSTGNAHKDDDDLYLTRERKSLPNIHRNKSELSTSKHLTVSGDRISLSYPSRNYIFHRSAFDWYNNKRALVLDDMEEILPIAGSLNKPHVRSIFDSSHLFKSFSRYSEPAALANDTNEKNIRTPIENDDYEDKKDKTLTNETELQLDSDQDNKTASNVNKIIHMIFNLKINFLIYKLEIIINYKEAVQNSNTPRLQTQQERFL